MADGGALAAILAALAYHELTKGKGGYDPESDPDYEPYEWERRDYLYFWASLVLFFGAIGLFLWVWWKHPGFPFWW